MTLSPFSILGRNKARTALVGFQLALTFAVCATAANVLWPRIQEATRSTGLIEDNAFAVTSVALTEELDPRRTVRDDLALIRSMSGVQAVTPAMGVPLTGLKIEGTAATSPSDSAPIRTSIYHVDEQGVEAFGVQLVSGRGFNQGEILRDAAMNNARWPSVIVTEALARSLFGTEGVLGKTIYFGREMSGATVVGVVRQLDGPEPKMSSPLRERSVMVPQVLTLNRDSGYLIRTMPGELGFVMNEIEEQLSKSNPNRTIRDLWTLKQVRLNTYFFEFALAMAFSGLLLLLLFANALGINAMSKFWIVERRTELAIRRALGATRLRIVREVISDSLIIASVGLVGGAALTFAFNAWSMRALETSRMPVWIVGLTFLLMLGLNVGSVLAPAIAAARTSISAAMRRS
jgi:putative ABC transport system permease protein